MSFDDLIFKNLLNPYSSFILVYKKVQLWFENERLILDSIYGIRRRNVIIL